MVVLFFAFMVVVFFALFRRVCLPLIRFLVVLWCLRNLGLKIFLKNFDYFLKLKEKGEYAIVAELTRMCKRMICGQKKYW